MRFLKTNTATRVTVGPFFDKTDGITPETALTVTSCKLTFMVDDAGVPTLVLDTAPTASGGANDMVHVTNDDAGFYDLELAAANVNYVGRAMLALTDAATHCPVFHEFMILPAMVYDSLVGGTDVLQADVTQLLGTAWLAPGTAGTPDVNTKLVGGTSQTGRDIGATLGAAGAGLTAVAWNAAWDAEVQSEVQDALDGTLADSIPADGTRPSISSALLMLTRFMNERSVSGTTVTVKKEDGSTTSFTLTLNDGTTPTSITRAT